MDNQTIERRSKLTYREFRDRYLRPQKPVVISGALEGWPAFNKWTPRYFKDLYGDKRISIENQELTLGQYLEEVERSSEARPARYLRGLIIPIEFPEILGDIKPDLAYTLPDRVRSRLLPFLRRPTPHGIPELLITGAGGRFKLHYDKFHMLGFVTQVYGDKEFTIFGPDQSACLYPDPDPERENWSRIVYPDRVDSSRFPRFADARPITFVLRRGETLFNPAGWWHATRALTTSIAMVISTVNETNWGAFTRDFARLRFGSSLPRRLRAQVYFRLAGLLLAGKERLEGRLVN